LRLRSNYLGNVAGISLGQLMKSPAGAKLWRLDMRTNRVEEEGACAMLDALRHHPQMREMRVGYNRQNMKQDMETTQLACILLRRALATDSCNRLEMLDLNNVRVGNDGMKRMSLALALNTLLKRLDLTFNSIGPEGAKALAHALERNRHLQHLDLRDNEVADEGAQALAQSLVQNQGDSALRKLLLARNEISPHGGMSLLAAIRAHEKLHIDFGATGGRLQGLMNRTPTMTDYLYMRDVEREISQNTEGLTSLMFSV